MRYVAVVLLIVSWSCCVRPQGITVEGVKCGVRNCQLNEYCSDVDRTCQNCDEVCDSTHHNYERPICEKQCQDYLHDLRYARKSGNGNGNNEEIAATVARLSRMVTVNLTLVCLMLIALVSFLSFQLYRWKDKRNITLASLKAKLFGKRQVADNNTTKGPKGIPNSEANKKPDLRLEMPTSGSNSDHSPVTITTSISRRPAEDSTLDYSYDNPAMSPPR